MHMVEYLKTVVNRDSSHSAPQRFTQQALSEYGLADGLAKKLVWLESTCCTRLQEANTQKQLSMHA